MHVRVIVTDFESNRVLHDGVSCIPEERWAEAAEILARFLDDLEETHVTQAPDEYGEILKQLCD